jgi:hypothetical protein
MTQGLLWFSGLRVWSGGPTAFGLGVRRSLTLREQGKGNPFTSLPELKRARGRESPSCKLYHGNTSRLFSLGLISEWIYHFLMVPSPQDQAFDIWPSEGHLRENLKHFFFFFGDFALGFLPNILNSLLRCHQVICLVGSRPLDSHRPIKKQPEKPISVFSTHGFYRWCKFSSLFLI